MASFAPALDPPLDHPRWLFVLPNGDVLVAETNAPPQPEDGRGLKGWLRGLFMSRAGAGVPSANRITLLRDSDGDGVAESRSVFLDGLHSPFGMALVGSDLYVADTDALLRFPYQTGQTRITAPSEKVTDLPAGPINHHWTKNVVASADGQAPLRDGRIEQQRRRERHRRRGGAAPRSGRSRPGPAGTGFLPRACATRSASPGSR